MSAKKWLSSLYSLPAAGANGIPGGQMSRAGSSWLRSNLQKRQNEQTARLPARLLSDFLGPSALARFVHFRGGRKILD